MIYDQHPWGEKTAQWWDEEDKEIVHEGIFSAVEAIDNKQDHRRVANLHYLRLYSNRLASGLTGDDYALEDEGDRIKLNVIKSVVDAATAQIATNRPRPQYITTGGNRNQINRAKLLNKFVSGQFHACEVYRTALRVFMDSCIFGTGFMHVFEGPRGIKCERVFPDEILVDDTEAKDCRPRTLYRHMELPRSVAIELWPKKRAEIENAKLIRTDTAPRMSQSDRISIVEAWRLPDGPDCAGRHVIACSGATLSDEPWERESFPFAVFRWCQAPLGFWGIGLAEELQSLQIEINYICQKIQNLFNMLTIQFWAKKGDGIGQMDNEDFGVRTYKSVPPTAISPTIPGELFMHLDRLYDKAFQISGVSQLHAQSEKPSGINSGEALRTYNDITSRRFMHVGQEWERFHLDVAELMLGVARDIEDRDDAEALEVLAQGDGEVELLKFSDVKIDENQYVTRVFPTSLLPDTPQGKLQTITELAQTSPEIGQHVIGLLTGIPDLEHVVSRINAPYELIDHILERIVDHGEFHPPLPYMDLNLARQQATLCLQKAHKDNVEEERLELLRRFIDQCDDLEAMAQPPAPPPGAMPPEPGPGAEMPPGMAPPGAPPAPGPQPGGMMPLQ